MEGLILPYNKTHCKDVVIKTVQYEYRHRQIDKQKHWHRKESPEQTEVYMRLHLRQSGGTLNQRGKDRLR